MVKEAARPLSKVNVECCKIQDLRWKKSKREKVITI